MIHTYVIKILFQWIFFDWTGPPYITVIDNEIIHRFRRRLVITNMLVKVFTTLLRTYVYDRRVK